MSILKRLALVVVLVVAALAVPTSAQAATPATFPAACAQAPTPAMPHRGITGKLLDPPTNPPARVGPGVTRFEVYGPSGQFFTQQEGCLQGAVDAVTGGAATAGQEATSGQTFSNWVMLAPEWGTAATASLASAAFDTNGWLAPLDPVWDTVSNALKTSLTQPFAPIVATVVLLLAGWALMSSRVGAFVGIVGVALVAASLLVVTPATVSHATDGLIVDTTTSVRQTLNHSASSDPGAAMIGELSDRIIYDSWCAGMLGSSDSITSARYCPRLYDATHLTWVEAARAEDNPDALKDIVEAKQDAWKDTLSDLKDEDEDAYNNVLGENGGNRVFQAFNAEVVWICTLPLLFVSLLLVVAAFLLIRVIATFFQVLALIAVVQAAASLRSGHARSTVLSSAFATLGAAVVNSIAFSTIASVSALVMVRVMGAESIPYLVRMLVCLALTVVFWIATKPFRKLTRMVGNWDPSKEFGKLGDKITSSLKGFSQQVVGTAIGSASGIKLSGVTSDHDFGEQTSSDREPRPYRQHFTRPDTTPVEAYALPAGARPDSPDLDAPEATPTVIPARTSRQSDVVVVKRPAPTAAAPVTDWPGPVTVDGVTVHDKADPTVRDLTEFGPGNEGTFVVYDTDLGLIEVSADAEEEA